LHESRQFEKPAGLGGVVGGVEGCLRWSETDRVTASGRRVRRS